MKILTYTSVLITVLLIAAILFLEIPENTKNILAATTVITGVTALFTYEMNKANK
jgi:hypothetical protein